MKREEAESQRHSFVNMGTARKHNPGLSVIARFPFSFLGCMLII